MTRPLRTLARFLIGLLLAVSFGAPVLAQSVIPAPASSVLAAQGQSSVNVSVQRILRAGARGVTPIRTVIPNPPTVTVGALNVASTVNGQATTFGAGTYQAINTAVLDFVAGRFAVSGTDYVGSIATANNTNFALRRGSHGQGIRFATDCLVFDINVKAPANSFIVYVTENGVRGRVSANDIAIASGGNQYVKFDWGSTNGTRIIEAYIPTNGSFRGINTPSTCSIWRAPEVDAPRVAILWDSFGMDPGSQATNATKLSVVGYMGQALGVPNILSMSSSGTGVLNRIFHSYGAFKGNIAGRNNGVLISNGPGEAVAYAMWNLEERGTMFVGAGEKTYLGMIIGENARQDDLDVNPMKAKQLTNVRASGKDESIRLTPPRRMTLEQAIAYIEEDELVEVTPKNIRLRKQILNPSFRKRRVKEE